MTKRWLMFRLHPRDLLVLPQWMANPSIAVRAAPLPSDTQVVDAFYDAERDHLVLVLESALFEPVEAIRRGTEWQGAWNEMVLDIDGEAAMPPGEKPEWPPTEARWEAYLLKPDSVLALVQAAAAGICLPSPPLPPDLRLRDAFYDTGRGAFILLVESGFFDPAPCERMEDGGIRMHLPERWFQVDPDARVAP